MATPEPSCSECLDVAKENNPCQECCPHDWDPDCGGMCANCGREDFWNFQREYEPEDFD